MPDLRAVFDELHRRLSAHEDAFLASHNLTDANAPGSRKVDEPSSDSYILLGAPTEKYPDGQMFAAIRLGQRYVSYYLMSVSADPTALERMSPELRGRMQGTSCFNFTRVDEQLLDELDELTRRGREQYAAAGLLRG